MEHDKFDVVLQFGQLDYSNGWYAYKYLKNKHYGVEIIKHNVSAEEAQRYVEMHRWDHIYKKEEENYHLKNFKASLFWTIAQED